MRRVIVYGPRGLHEHGHDVMRSWYPEYSFASTYAEANALTHAVGTGDTVLAILVVSHPSRRQASRIGTVSELFGIAIHLVNFDSFSGLGYIERNRVQLIVIREEDIAYWNEIMLHRESSRFYRVPDHGVVWPEPDPSVQECRYASLVRRLFYQPHRGIGKRVLVASSYGVPIRDTGICCGTATVLRGLTVDLAAMRTLHVVQTAGVLPVAVDPRSSNVYVLLGRETYKKNPLLDDGAWGDFSGHVAVSDADIEAAAAREFEEESIGTVWWGGRDVARALRDKEFVFDVSASVTSYDCMYEKRLFVIRVPWQPGVCRRFDKARREVVSSSSEGKEWLEKQSIKWWSLTRIREMLLNNSSFRGHRLRVAVVPMLAAICDRFPDQMGATRHWRGAHSRTGATGASK